MMHEWFATIELPLTWQQFRQLPRNPAYKYEYFDGRAWLSPRPKSYHAVLDLPTFVRPVAEMVTDEELVVRPLQDADWQRLPRLFAAAFHRVQPFASLTDEDRLAAAEDCLGRTRAFGEGPLIGEACCVAACPKDDLLVAANLITVPPAEAVDEVAGGPHLTWILVEPDVCPPGRRHGPAGHGSPGLAATRIRGTGQHVPARQRVEHALALAGRLRIAGGALVDAGAAKRTGREMTSARASRRGPATALLAGIGRSGCRSDGNGSSCRSSSGRNWPHSTARASARRRRRTSRES